MRKNPVTSNRCGASAINLRGKPMSIVTKVTVLFIVSLALMIGIGYQIDRLNTQKYESVLLQKYLLDGRKIFGWMATSSSAELTMRLKTLNLVQTSAETPKRFILRQPHTFGTFEIFEAMSGDYVMHLRYIDDDLYLRDTNLREAQREEWILNAFIIADIAVLAIIFALIIRMLSPLGAIASSMRRFAQGEYASRSDVHTRDEIGEVANTYNEMAQTIENLILSRQELLRDIGHELRTPIARGMFALEQIGDSNVRESLKRSFTELDQLTRELLEIEKLRSAEAIAHDPFSAETLVLEALGKLHLVDESAIEVTIASNFTLHGDVHYLSLALKNLMDNALKYADTLPIEVRVEGRDICVMNRGKALSKEVSQLVEAFVREEESRTTPGFGLGLNIVARIVEKHGYRLTYAYENGTHRFCICTGLSSRG